MLTANKMCSLYLLAYTNHPFEETEIENCPESVTTRMLGYSDKVRNGAKSR